MKEIKCRDLLPSEIECRVGSTSKDGTGFSLLLYKTARADMTLLDEVYGINNWQCEYYQVKNTMVCCISIWDSEKQQWIKKCDGGDDDYQTEQVKAELSDAFKRAGFRVLPSTRKLYNSPFIWIKVSDKNTKYERYSVKEIGYDETSVVKLVIVNDKTSEVVYSYPKSNKVSTSGEKVAKNPIPSNDTQFSKPNNVFEEDKKTVREYLDTLPADKWEQFTKYLKNHFGKGSIGELNESEMHTLALSTRR